MKLSKTRFMQVMKYLRYRNFDHFMKPQEKTEDADDLELLKELEDKNKFKSIEDDEEEDEIEEVLDNHQVMMPYYQKVEMLTAQKIKDQFGGKLKYSMYTNLQQHFETTLYGHDFHCFLDGFQEDEKTIRIIESKATTSRKYLKMTYKDENKDEQSVFVYSPEGILMLREDLGLEIDEKYHKKTKSLYNKYSKEGKYIYDLAYQRFVIEKSKTVFNKPVKYYLAVLNSDYEFDGKVDLNGEPIYTNEIITFIDLTSLTEKYMKVLEEDSIEVSEVLYQLNQFPNALDYTLNVLSKLETFTVKEIYQDVLPEKNHIFTMLERRHIKDDEGTKIEYHNFAQQGIYHVLDLPQYVFYNKKNEIQKQTIENDYTYIDKARIKAALKDLKYPLYHLDFESFNCPLPRFRGEHPYDQSLFQFSLHIEHAPGVCDKDKDHFEFLAPDHNDHRKELAKKLVELIKDDGGDVIAYNYSFEKTRLKELAYLFPEYAEKLLNIMDRTYDLMHILRGNKALFKRLGFDEDGIFNYYHENLQGSFSIKKVLPVFTDLTYKGLKIGNGTEALTAYASFPSMKEKTYKEAYKNLLFYCKQDTWAMVEVLRGLRKIL